MQENNQTVVCNSYDQWAIVGCWCFLYSILNCTTASIKSLNFKIINDNHDTLNRICVFEIILNTKVVTVFFQRRSRTFFVKDICMLITGAKVQRRHIEKYSPEVLSQSICTYSSTTAIQLSPINGGSSHAHDGAAWTTRSQTCETRGMKYSRLTFPPRCRRAEHN